MYTQQVGLCKQIVREHYGPIVETVVDVLLREGRMHLGQLANRTKLTGPNVRQALAVLIQHGIATHALSKVGPRMLTFYSVCLKSILRLQRAGLYLALVEERMGSEGLAIFRTIMVNGLTTIGNVREALGIAENGNAAKIKFNSVVAKLVRDRYIIAVNTVDTITKVDRIMQEEVVEVEKMTLPPTAKELLAIRRKILEREEEEYQSSTVVGIKRRASVDISADHSSKLHMSADGRANGFNNYDSGDQNGHSHLNNGHQQQQQVDAVDDKQFFRAYYDRLDVFLRNQQIVNYFSDKYNAGAGALVKSILRATEQHTRTCRVKLSETVSSTQVFQHISAEAPLIDSIDTSKDMFHQKFDANGNPIVDTSSGTELSREKRSEIIFALLEVIHTDSSGIIIKVDDRGTGQYRVSFERAAITLRERCVDALVHEKFGSVHARLLRVLRDKQKLDEKVVAQATMLPIGPCRARLHDLALAGIIDTIEIPRSADRNPSRMFYLWYVNADKQMRSALRFVYQGMSNIIERSTKEVSARALLIAKTKREDVILDPSLLTDGERKELNNLARIKQKLAIANVRLDSMLLVIYDIDPQSAELQLLQ
ncbi:RNA polymerase III subunit C82 [Coemansia sp. RSA 2337]|nr:RNA polymerase III subunit C82 [Coemansia sp. S155-1]KAJ2461837.1 RNA polymerase III subunit C82 [Coemansia sp. RSA 2337]